jgi:oligopeptide/dipeptide ABC transporter ATP-binding protein
VRAVDGISFDLARGETLALVGESGSGKTTVGRALVRANEPRSGSITLDGQELTGLSSTEMRPLRSRLQMVFQDPYASIDPRKTVGQVLAEPLRVHRVVPRKAQRERIVTLLRRVGLDPSFVGRYPHEMSGGQRQRVGIARALAVDPDVIVCDEPISALDVSIQAQIVNLLARLRDESGLTYLFIAHDLAIVRHLAHRVAVMYLGHIVELAPADTLYSSPGHPYTRALLSAVPIPDSGVEKKRARVVLKGDIPSPIDPPSGCPFHPRCPLRAALGDPELCVTEKPLLARHGDGDQTVACHFWGHAARAE